ncbi:MAG: response regulator [Actinophytocola sp.]|uniref:response regulator transcription factor n=1 Tax=Actinophytocola sp. TaxID=1872138 RepID=UPI0013289C17|nr:response regulator transcription factor [Actinophytocola sp.]MPZ79001.1 response regulator [Actinophytocola sp.]
MGLQVFLVHGDELVRRGVAQLLDDEPSLAVVGQTASVADALERVSASAADVAVLGTRLPDGDGIELCRVLCTKLPGLRCLMLTPNGDGSALFDAIMAGASAFLPQQTSGADLIEAIRTIGPGGSLLDARTATAFCARIREERQHTDPLAALSEQERAVFELIGEGLTNRQIGEQMSRAEKTVKNYVSHVLAKLGLQRRTQAALLAAHLHSSDRVEEATNAHPSVRGRRPRDRPARCR